MQQRQLRLGDILDDYCPRERRLTNHAVVAMIGQEILQTRCTTCDAEHEYKHAKVPRPRKKEESAGVPGQVVAGAPAPSQRGPAANRAARRPLPIRPRHSRRRTMRPEARRRGPRTGIRQSKRQRCPTTTRNRKRGRCIVRSFARRSRVTKARRRRPDPRRTSPSASPLERAPGGFARVTSLAGRCSRETGRGTPWAGRAGTPRRDRMEAARRHNSPASRQARRHEGGRKRSK